MPRAASASSAGARADDDSARADTPGPRPSGDSAAGPSRPATGRPPPGSRRCSTGPGGREARRTGRSLSADTAGPAAAAAAATLALDGDLVDRWTGPREGLASAAGQVSEESFSLSSEANARLPRTRLPPHRVTLLKNGNGSYGGGRRRCRRTRSSTPSPSVLAVSLTGHPPSGLGQSPPVPAGSSGPGASRPDGPVSNRRQHSPIAPSSGHAPVSCEPPGAAHPTGARAGSFLPRHRRPRSSSASRGEGRPPQTWRRCRHAGAPPSAARRATRSSR